MATQRFPNNFSTSVAATFGATDTMLQLTSTSGLPVLSGGDYVLLTVYRQAGAVESGHEVLKLTSYTGTQCNVVRQVEGAAPSQFNVGDRVQARITGGALEAKSDKAVTDTAIALKADAAATTAALAAKADAAATTAALDLKADAANVTSALSLKANQTDVTASLALKADQTALTAGLALKADATTTITALAAKANASDVATSLALKADQSAMTTALGLKADITYVGTQISNLVNASPAALDTLKELATALGNDANFSTTMTNALANKAAKGANADITSLTGLTTALSVAQGGTGVATLTGVVYANGTGAMTAATASQIYTLLDGLLRLDKASVPQLVMKDTDAGADLGQWAMWVNEGGDTIAVGPQTDAGTGTQRLTISRAGAVKAYGNAFDIDNGTAASDARLTITGKVGQHKAVTFTTGGSTRWQMGSDNANEVGSAGSNFYIARYNSSGTFVDNALTISRPTGSVTISHSLAVTQSASAAGLTTTADLNVNSVAPAVIWNETDQTGAVGMWRMMADGGNLRIDMNTAAGKDFSTFVTQFTIDATGMITMAQGATFSGPTKLKAESTTFNDMGTSGAGSTITFDYRNGTSQRVQIGGATTLAFSNWPSSGERAVMMLELVNGGAYSLTLPSINWVLPNGAFTTNVSTYMTAIGRTGLQSAGLDFCVLWTRDGGTTIYGAFI